MLIIYSLAPDKVLHNKRKNMQKFINFVDFFMQYNRHLLTYILRLIVKGCEVNQKTNLTHQGYKNPSRKIEAP